MPIPRRFRQAVPIREQGSQSISRRRTLGMVGIPLVMVASAAIVIGLTRPGGPGTSPGSSPPPISLPTGAAAADGSPGGQTGPTTEATPLPSAPPPSAGIESGLVPDAPRSAEPEALTGYHWPLRRGRISAFFAPRDEGFLVVDDERIHEGLDVTTFCGDRIRAAHDGIVLAAGRRAAEQMAFSEPLDAFFARIDRRGSEGYLSITVVIDDGNGYRSVYAHLSDVAVEVGQRVKSGRVIGYEGATGNASGCHLHYEMIRTDGPWMKVAGEFVSDAGYPPLVRERIDPLRVLSLDAAGAPRFIPGIDPPKESPGLGRPTATPP